MSISEEEVDVWDDDGDGNLMALFVLDETPVATINEILYWNYEDSDSKLWPANTYDSLPDYLGTGPKSQIRLPLPPDWRSPFVGKTIPEVVAFMRNVPKPPKPLNTRYCAILRQEYLAEGCVYICKSLEGEVRQDDQVASDEEAENEISDDQIDSDTDIDIREGCNPMLAMVLEAEREMIKERVRKRRAERLAGNVEKTDEEKTKPKHENDFENIQLIPTSNDMISLLNDGMSTSAVGESTSIGFLRSGQRFNLVDRNSTSCRNS